LAILLLFLFAFFPTLAPAALRTRFFSPPGFSGLSPEKPGGEKNLVRSAAGASREPGICGATYLVYKG